MKVYVDSEYHCHTTNPDGTFREVDNRETEFFDEKCESFIEGYCYDDSKGYPAIYPWKDYSKLDAAQREYERQKLAEYETLIDELYAEVTAE